jgi:plastocyanin
MLLGLLISIALLAAGCDRQSAPTNSAPRIVGSAALRGRVVLLGTAPPRALLAESGRCCPGSPEIRDESILAAPDGGLKNVIVYLENAPMAQPIDATTPVLDQVNCRFTPHVLAVQVGQTLRLKSSDPVMHNVHLQCQVNPDINYGFNGPGYRDISFDFPETTFRVKCDVHPWMTAYIAVFNHPWFAITGDDGTFEIDHVPPGTYTLAAWQEALPMQTQTIVVTDAGLANLSFTFKAP